MNITDRLLPYNDVLELRDESEIELVVLHCTELPALKEAREYGERILYPESGTGASGHFYIDRDGAVYRYVEETRMARHVVGYNARSLGIELVNAGRYPRWFHASHQIMTEPYSDAQILSLKDLLTDLRRRYPSLTQIARHSDLDTRTIPAEDDPSVEVRRRLDPGPLFPWDTIRAFWSAL